MRPPIGGNVTVQATTPRGFLATIAADGVDWQQLTLAVDSTDTPLAFTGIGWDSDLRRALQANQLFLVISDPEAVRNFFTQNQLTVDGFTFDLNPDRWADHGTILLFKFHDKPITDLIAATDQWTLPDRFNVNPGQARSRLARLINDALAKVPEDATQAANPQTVENYRNLADAARLPQWTGVLALNVSVGPEDLPPELQGLAAGIDASKFYAQYVGVELNQVRPDGLDLKMEQSAIFGLIDYQDDGPPPPNDSGYNFYVSRLNALFENAKLKFFASDINVTVDRLFDERTALRGSPNGRNQIVLAGRREDHDGKPAYVFSFRGSNRFALPDSPTLYEVEIVKAAFTTDPPAAPAGYVAGEAVRSRFQFWGRLNFHRLDDFDILSFGPDTAEDDPDAPPSDTALSFSGLTLSMTFTWQSTAARSFVLDADALRFDLSQSKPRPGSLYAKFPLKLLTLTRGDAQTTPDTLGYMPVKTPLAARKPDGNWYALTFELDLGSVGALAGSAGIVVGVLAAWRPGEDGVYVGLRLPGSSGGKKEIALQGVLKIVFNRIEFVTVPGADVASTRYLLKLKNIVLKFMLLSIPPSGQSEIILFGDPSGGDTKTLGWYAAYAKSGPRRPEPNKLPKGLF
ncbi:MAG: hypothetical protein R2873_35305 [Caldilineaceae bacterium]